MAEPTNQEKARERLGMLHTETYVELSPEQAKAYKPRALSLDTLDTAELPPVQDAPVVELEEPVEETGDPRAQLARVVTKAIAFLEEVLNHDSGIALTIADARLLSIQLQAAQTAINTQAKVDDTQLRARQVDMIPKILELIAKEEKQLPGRLLELTAE